MNLICPHCQKPLSIPDDKAGQNMACPLCYETFQAPALPPNAQLSFDFEELPDDIPLVPITESEPAPVSEAKAPPPPSSSAPAPSSTPEEPVYMFTPEAPKAEPPPPPKRPKPSPTAAQQRPSAPKAIPPSAPATGYQSVRTVHLRPDVVQWVAPISLALVFVLFFFNWVGCYPSGYAVYTQSGSQAMRGKFSYDPVGEKVMNKQTDIESQLSSNWFLAPIYILIVLAGLALAIASLVARSARQPFALPPALERIWPWRTALVGVLSAIALLILLLLLLSGLGLENAIKDVVDQDLAKEKAAAKTDEEKQTVEIKRGQALGGYNLHRTSWLSWIVLLQLAAIAGAGLELWLEKRGSRPLPRVEVQW